MLKLKKSVVVTLVALSSTVMFSQNILAEESKNFDDQASYTVGYATGENFLKNMLASQKDVIHYNNDQILAGIKDALNDKPVMSKEELQTILLQIENKVAESQNKAITESNEKLMADFAKKPGVQKTKSGILYRVEKEGKGDKIALTDKVKVDYTGKLGNGVVFDSSKDRGPVEFPLNAVIKGWQEAIPFVKKGGSIEMVIPAKLAYGERGAGPIPPNASLYFQVDVLDVKK